MQESVKDFIEEAADFFWNKCESKIVVNGNLRKCSGKDCRFWKVTCRHPEFPGNVETTETKGAQLVA